METATENKIAKSVTLRPENINKGLLLGGGHLSPHDGSVQGGNLSMGVDIAFAGMELAGEAIQVLKQVYAILRVDPDRAAAIAAEFLAREKAASDGG